MAFASNRKIHSVSVREEWGVVDDAGFRLVETHRDALSGNPFTVCRIEDKQIAVFSDVTIPADVRTSLSSRRPDWLNAMVYARVISDPRATTAVIEAELLGTDGVDLAACGFATACVVFGSGAFKVVPESYQIRFEGGACVLATMDFDDDSESWFGDAALVDDAASR